MATLMNGPDAAGFSLPRVHPSCELELRAGRWASAKMVVSSLAKIENDRGGKGYDD